MLGLFYEMTLGKINLKYGVPTGIRTPVTAVKGRCPRPLDDRDNRGNSSKTYINNVIVEFY